MCEDQLIDENDYRLLYLFVREAKNKTSQMLILLSKLDDDLRDQKKDEVFAILQAILLFSAQLSFIFHSEASKETKKRSGLLRAAFGIDQALDFLSDRSFRNHIAHMDERLHSWSKQSPNQNIVREVISPRGTVGGSAISSKDIFEHYVPDEKIFIFRGDEFDLKKLFAAVDLINKRATAIGQQPYWAPSFKALFAS